MGFGFLSLAFGVWGLGVEFRVEGLGFRGLGVEHIVLFLFVLRFPLWPSNAVSNSSGQLQYLARKASYAGFRV